jgi:hypothetical protein
MNTAVPPGGSRLAWHRRASRWRGGGGWPLVPAGATAVGLFDPRVVLELRLATGTTSPSPPPSIAWPKPALPSIGQATTAVNRPKHAFAGFCPAPEVIVLAVRWTCAFGLSYRDVEELLAERGIKAGHVTVYRWCSASLACSPRRPGPAGVRSPTAVRMRRT